jgi:hypothetical protein
MEIAMNGRGSVVITRILSMGLLAAMVAGCGSSIETHPVRGKVVFEGVGLASLGEAHVELRLESDPSIRASGPIEPDGSFELTTLHNGQSYPGAMAGSHKARIVLSDYDYEEPEAARDDGGAADYRPKAKRFKASKGAKDSRASGTPPIPEKYMSFNSSGLSLEVPPQGAVTFTVYAPPQKKKK